MREKKSATASLRKALYRRAVLDAFKKLNPRNQVRNPVMFVTEVGSLFTTILWIQALAGKGEAPASFVGAISLWLWFTVLFANFSEALAEGRGKAQAELLRKARQDTPARKLRGSPQALDAARTSAQPVSSTALQKGDLYLVEAGEILPADGEIIVGIASVDESAVTGESASLSRSWWRPLGSHRRYPPAIRLADRARAALTPVRVSWIARSLWSKGRSASGLPTRFP